MLQQLALFSAIELPNLEQVSLNNIHLRDVSIDPKRLGKLFGFRLRRGRLKDISLTGGMVDGVMVKVSGVDLVVEPSVGSTEPDARNSTFLLAQSTADLAKTVVFSSPDDLLDLGTREAADSIISDRNALHVSAPAGPDDNTPDESKSGEESNSGSTSPFLEPRKASALGGVMSKAVDIALLRLHICIEDVSMTIVIEPVNLLLQVEEINFDTVSGVRSLAIKGIKLSVLQPFVNPGSKGKPTKHDVNATIPSTGESLNDDTDPDTDPDTSLTDSMVFTHEEASLIYMSAASQNFVPKNMERSISKPQLSTRVVILYIDRAMVSFEGAMLPTDLKVNVNCINVAAIPLFPTATLVLQVLSRLSRLRAHDHAKQNAKKHSRSRSLPPSEFSAESGNNDENQSSFEPQPDTDLSLFNKIHASEIVISLTSALNSDGTFASYDDDMSIFFTNCSVKQKVMLFFGGVERLECLLYQDSKPFRVFSFADDGLDNKADFRFEVQCKKESNTEATILFSKSGNFKLDAHSFLKLAPFTQYAAQMVDYGAVFSDFLAKARTANHSVLSSKLQQHIYITLQTASFDVSVALLPTFSLQAHCFPISFSSAQNAGNIHKIILSFSVGGITTETLVVPHLRLSLSAAEFSTYVSGAHSQKALLSCATNLYVGPVSGSVDAELLYSTFCAFDGFLEEVRKLVKEDGSRDILRALAPIPISAKSYGYSSAIQGYPNSAMHAGRRIVKTSLLQKQAPSFRLLVELATFTVYRIFPIFGDFSAEFKKFSLYALSSGIFGTIDTFSASRVISGPHTKQKEPFVHEMDVLPSVPMLSLKWKSNKSRPSLDLEIRRFYVEYYAKWLSLFQNDVSQGHDAEEIIRATPNPEKRDFIDIRLTLFGFAIGLTPLMLPSKISIAVAKGTVDFTSSKTQWYVKSSFRDLLLLLCDERLHLLTPNTDSYSVRLLLLARGYVEAGSANSCHVGVTINTDIEEVKRRNAALGISGELPLLDMKLNSDDQNLTLCADSAHTLLQTLENLKEALILEDSDKCRVLVDGFSLPLDIQQEIENINTDMLQNFEEPVPGLSSCPHQRRMSEDFLIVDEYYGGSRLDSTELDDTIDLSHLQLQESANSPALLNFVEGHFSEKLPQQKPAVVPFKLNINSSKVQIYLFDGYDWKATRKSFRQAVKGLKRKAENKNSDDPDVDQECSESTLARNAGHSPQEQVEELLFNSIHITSNASEDHGAIIQNINSQLQNEQVEASATDYRDLKLTRSRLHKIMAEMKNVELNVTNYTSRDPRKELVPSDLECELINKIDVRIDTLTVYDNVPSSTWNKLISYMSSIGEREVGTNMVHLQITNVRPDAKLIYTEAMASVKLLPLRLYVDQDTLDFVTRFFGFKDLRFNLPVDEIVYFQKFTLEPLKLKFDYKPKRMDLAGLRGGNHAEWANLFVLNGSTLSLEGAVIYGAHGFPDLGAKLGQVYGPYIQRCQILGLLSGIGPVRSLYNVGKGFKDFVAEPLKEYQNDGRLIYGLQKGTKAFAKTTSYELLRLGINLASGLQVALETLEEYFGGEGMAGRRPKERSRTDARKEVRGSQPSKGSQLQRKPNLMETSHNLRAIAVEQGDLSDRQQKYSLTVIDEDLDLDSMQPSILIFDPSSDFAQEEAFESGDSGESEEKKSGRKKSSRKRKAQDVAPGAGVGTDEKLVSLYSHQPKNTRAGLKSAYRSLAKNMTSTMQRLSDMRQDLQEAESFPDQLKLIAKSSPVLVIRPIIGTTEATMQALMGLSNDINSWPLREARDKYRVESLSSE